MDINITGICITVLIGVICLSLAIFLGLRGFTGKLGKKVEQTKNDIVAELSGINEKVIKIENTADKVWELAKVIAFGGSGTVEVKLVNFGTIKISAEPGTEKTVYTLNMSKGQIYDDFLVKIANETELRNIEASLFKKKHVNAYCLNPRLLKVEVPSTDPKICTQFISKFLKWLDTTYKESIPLIEEYEKGIEA